MYIKVLSSVYYKFYYIWISSTILPPSSTTVFHRQLISSIQTHIYAVLAVPLSTWSFSQEQVNKYKL